MFTSRNITTINCTPASTFLAPYYCSYSFIPLVFHYLFAELVHLLGVLGTQETSCFVVAGLHERDIFDLFLPEFDKPWVIHLRETCCCSTNLCSWRPNTVYKNRSTRRHQALFWRRCRGGKVKGTHTPVPGNSTFLAPLCVCSKLFPLDSAIATFGFLFTLVRHNGQQ
jgi:hypothetical protein